METSVNNKCKAFTSLEQSHKLAKILPIESADMRYSPLGDNMHPWIWTDTFIEKDAIPCWSLAALLDYMHKVDLFPDITDFNGEFKLVVSYVNEEEEKILGNVQTIISRNENLIDGFVKIIELLHEQKIL